MSESHTISLAAIQTELSNLQKVAATSTDECVVATLIAAQDSRVQQKVVEKAANYVWKGLSCAQRADGKIAVVFNFECRPGQFWLVKPWFATIVDLEFGTVYGIQDPYRPVTTKSKSCGCAKKQAAPARGVSCDSSAGASLRNVRVEDLKIKGEVWARLNIDCDVVGTIIDFDDKLFDFEIDRNGGSAERDIDVGCAHLHLRVYTNDLSVCVHWDITGCEVEVFGNTVFEFDEHAEKCVSI